MLFYVTQCTVGHLKPWKAWQRTSLAAKWRSCRAQRADEAATVVLVCEERPRHNNWFMDSSPLFEATVRPLSQHESADLRAVLATVSSCVWTLDRQKKTRVHLDHIYSEITSRFILPSSSTLKCLLKLHYELLCVFSDPQHGVSLDQRGHTSCFLAHVLILFLCPLIFSAPLTFNLSHSWGCRTAGLVFCAALEAPTVTVQLSL